MPSRTELDNTGVLVTRPAHQAGPLCTRITAAGGRPVRFPLLVIRDLTSAPQVVERLSHLADYHIAIFISPNAVQLGLTTIDRHGGLPNGLKLATVGQGSARSIKNLLGRGPDIAPTDRFDSEGLLALPSMQTVTGQKILIFRGEGGRELLAQTLRQRGATVDYLELYRRECPSREAAEQDWLKKTDIITITSSEALHNLFMLASADEIPLIQAKPLIVVSERTAESARELGFHNTVIVAPRADDETIFQALIDWVHRQPTEH